MWSFFKLCSYFTPGKACGYFCKVWGTYELFALLSRPCALITGYFHSVFETVISPVYLNCLTPNNI